VTAKSAPIKTLSTVMMEQWEQGGRKLTALAEAFPADRYDWKPADGVRTVADVLRHVAFWNQYVAAVVQGKTADDQANELPKEQFSSKAKIMQAVQQSLEDVAGALRDSQARLDPQAAETIMSFVGHNSEHYGQLAIYARLSGIVPPASRG
jgi:uncharacterized damage-inducible protein DinB